MFYEVIPIRVFHENGSTLTYSSSLSLKPGHIVEIPLGRAKTYAIVVRKVSKVNFATKDITRLLYDTPLPQHIVKAIFWLSEYYLTPLPLVAKLFLPQGIGKNRRKTAAKTTSTSDTKISPASIPLNQYLPQTRKRCFLCRKIHYSPRSRDCSHLSTSPNFWKNFQTPHYPYSFSSNRSGASSNLGIYLKLYRASNYHWPPFCPTFSG